MAKRTSKSGPTAKPTTAHRIVVLAGKEAYLRRAHTEKLREALEAQGPVDVLAHDGANAQAADVFDDCRSMGLMAQHRLVVVDNADGFLASKDGVGKPPRELLERYAEAPADDATLVLRAETWRKGKVDALIETCGVIVKCDQVNEAQAAGWAIKRAGAGGAELERRAAGLLIDRLGTDLARVGSEVDKLVSAAGTPEHNGKITADLVRQFVGVSREEQVWSVQQPLLAGHAEGAIAQIRELLTVSRQPDILIRFAITDLAKKAHSAARAMASGASAQAVASELKLWGPAKEGVLGMARRADVDALAQLLHVCVQADVRAKTGQGDPARELETLAVRFTSIVR